MRKVLIIGDFKSIWVKYLVANVIMPLNYEIFFLCEESQVNEVLGIYGTETRTITFQRNQFFAKIPKIRSIDAKNKMLAALKNYDFSDFKAAFSVYTTPFTLKCFNNVVSHYMNCYCLFIGSDMLRAKNFDINSMKRQILHFNPSVICTRSKIQLDYSNRMWDGKRKVDAYIPYGNSVIEHISTAKNIGKEKCKEYFSLNKSKIAVTIGYNGSSAQNHLTIINSLAKISDENKNKIELIFLMTYSIKQKYVEKIINTCKKANLQFKLIKNYLSYSEMGMFWVANDIFIHGQITDAFCASLLESVFANNIVLNGAWLDYPEKNELGLSFNTFSRFEQLGEIVDKIVCGNFVNITGYKDAKLIFEYASWDKYKEKWIKIINSKETANEK